MPDRPSKVAEGRVGRFVRRMRWLGATVLAMLGAACSSVSSPVAPGEAAVPTESFQASAPTPAPQPGVAETPPAAKTEPLRPLKFLRTERAGIRIEAVTFDSRRHRFRVADQPDGPGTRWSDAGGAAAALGGVAAVNGGFFTPGGDPLGRVITDGRAAGSVNRTSSLGSGFVVETRSGSELLRRDSFSGGKEALQCGPFLVERGRVVGGLSDRRSSARTLVATDGAHGWIVARTGACTLSELAAALADAKFGAVRVRDALNLDGGRSSEIWVSGKIDGGPAHTRPLWNKPVRNFLVVVPR